MSRDRGNTAAESAGKTSAFGLTEIWSQGEQLKRLGRWALLKQVVLIAWRSVVSSPLTALLTLATMTVSLFLLAAFCLVLQTLSRVAVETRSDVALTLFLKNDAAAAARETLEGELRAQPEVASVNFTSNAQALEDFGRSLGDDAALLEGLAEKNPLPASFEVKFKSDFSSLEVFRDFSARYETNPAVEHIHFSGGVVGRLGAIMQTLRVGGGGAILFMLVATGFLMANTIKLALYAHRNEVEIMRLVGATHAFVRAPFIIEGTAQGFLGAAAGLICLWAVTGVVQQIVARSEVFSQVVTTVPFLGPLGVLLVILSGTLVGFVGSFLAVRRFSIE